MPSLLDQLKVPVLIVFISLLIFFGLSKLLGPIPFTVNSIQTTKADLFTVNGVGEVDAVPQNASVTLGMTQTGSTSDAATNNVNKVINQLIADLKELGIDEDNIQTENLSVNPNYDFTNGSQTITGYTASQNLRVKVEQVELANQAIDAATTNGANVVSGLSFEMNDEEKEELLAQARKKAITDAKEKAQTIAREAGIKLGKVVNIQVEEGGEEMPIPFEARNAADMVQKAEPTNLQPGESTVRVTVYLSYETL